MPLLKTSRMLRLGSDAAKQTNIVFLKASGRGTVYKNGNLRFLGRCLSEIEKSKSDRCQGHPALKVQGLGSTQMFLIMTELGICPVSVLLFGRQEQMNGMRRMDVSKCHACKATAGGSLRWETGTLSQLKSH